MGMKLLAKVTRIYERIISGAMVLAGISTVFLMVSVSLDVVLRYFLGRPTAWVMEITGYMLLYIPFLVAAWVLKRDRHVRMDLVLNRLNPKTQSLVNTITSIIGVIICLVLTWSGAKATLYFIGYQTPTMLRVPKSAIIVIIFLGSLLLVIQFLRRTRSYLRSWRAPPEKEEVIEKLGLEL